MITKLSALSSKFKYIRAQNNGFRQDVANAQVALNKMQKTIGLAYRLKIDGFLGQKKTKDALALYRQWQYTHQGSWMASPLSDEEIIIKLN